MFLLDSCVFIAALDPNEQSHKVCRDLILLCVKKKIDLYLPMHGVFEIAATFRRKKEEKEKTITIEPSFYDESHGIPIKNIPIDENFLKEYGETPIPYIKGGDTIYLAISAKTQCFFVTNDDNLYRKSKELNKKTFKPKEMLEHLKNENIK